MNDEINLVVEAIKSLKEESDFLKDYIFPLGMAFFSALLGALLAAGVAFFTYRHQEITQIEKDKLNSANKWILSAEEAFSSLIAIKTNYYNKLTDYPLQRTAQIPTILNRATPIEGDISSLSFMIPNKDDSPNKEIKWRQITTIRAMVKNYNHLLDLWEKRNELERPLREKIVKEYANQAYASVNFNQIVECVGMPDLLTLIDLTERVIIFTDHMIIELNDFLLNFPPEAKLLINTKRIKNYGSVLLLSNNENEKLLEILNLTLEVDYNELSKLYDKPPEEIKSRLSTGYE